MKLKEAIKKAKEVHVFKIQYIAVDSDGEIWGFTEKPVNTGTDVWGSDIGKTRFIGDYTGSKDWKETLREV